jgi:hypothetical protein
MLLQLRRNHKRWLLDPALCETPLVGPQPLFEMYQLQGTATAPSLHVVCRDLASGESWCFN